MNLTIFTSTTKKPDPTTKTAMEVISDTLKNAGVTELRADQPEKSEISKRKSLKKLGPSEARYAFIKKSIDKSQAVIIEASADTFQLGHEATLALLFNKPVLCLSRKADYQDSIHHPNFLSHKYKKNTELPEIVMDLIKHIKNKHLSVRFNAFLSPTQKNFLDWYAGNKQTTASDLLRELIDGKIEDTPEYHSDARPF